MSTPRIAKSVLRKNPLLSFLTRNSPASLATSAATTTTTTASTLNSTLNNSSSSITPPTSTSSSSSSSSSSSLSQSFLPYVPLNPSEPSPFAPSKKPGESRQWNPPRYSLRRQKKLIINAIEQGYDPSSILPAPHVNYNPKSTTTTTTATGEVKPATYFTSSNIIAGTSVLDGLKLVKMGPYKGRKGSAFKGKIWERKKEARLNQLEVLLEAADEKEKAWREGLKLDKKKGKTVVPF